MLEVTQADMAYAKSIVEGVEAGCTYEDKCISVRNYLARHRTEALAAKDAEIAELRAAFLQTREMLGMLEELVCEETCPSQWRQGQEQPHNKLHIDVRDVLSRHEHLARQALGAKP